MATLLEQSKFLAMRKRVNCGDQETCRKMVILEVAYKLHAKDVYTLAFRLLADRRAAEDLTVSVFAKFNRELPRYWDESKIAARLRELAIDESLQTLSERLEDLLDSAKTPSSSAIDSDGAKDDNTSVMRQPLTPAMLAALTSQLPDHLRVVFVLHDLEGLNNQRIARHLRIDEAIVRKLISKARLALRRLWLTQI